MGGTIIDLSGFTKMFDDIGQWFRNLFSSFFDSLRAMFNNFINTITDVFNNIVNTIRNTIDSFVATIRNTIDNLVASISGVFNGIIKGISGALQGIWDAISGVLAGIGGFFQQVFGWVLIIAGALIGGFILYKTWQSKKKREDPYYHREVEERSRERRELLKTGLDQSNKAASTAADTASKIPPIIPI